jgi:2'-hydroxyisoflavone reductase
MKILVMGGTLFAGKAIVDAAVSAGHDVTLLNRGLTNPSLRPDVEHLLGDRNVDLSALTGRSFDEVVDSSAYFPRHIHGVIDALDGRIDHYTFISSVSVYARNDVPFADETAELANVEDERDETADSSYGGFKALCEHALEERMPGKSHHVRAGIIVGPADNTGRYSYWVQRFCQGGRILLPEPRAQAVQYIDVRDLADWVIAGAENHVTGAFNVTSEPGETLEAMMNTFHTSVKFSGDPVWVDEDFLVRNEVTPFSELPMWLPPSQLPLYSGFFLRHTSKAVNAGLKIRPRMETVQAIQKWLESGQSLQTETDFSSSNQLVGLTMERESTLIRESSLG